MYFRNFLTTIILVILLVSCGESQRKNRWRKKSKGKSDCHMSFVQKCFDVIEEKNNAGNRHLLLKNAEGLDEICRDIQDMIDCTKKHVEQCGTPLQYEYNDFITEYLIRSKDKSCKAGPLRNDFLAISDCYANKVLNSPEYIQECSRAVQITISAINPDDDFDDRIDSLCCATNRWKDCVDRKTEKFCGKAALEPARKFRDTGVGNLMDVICPQHTFSPAESDCPTILSRYANATEINTNHTMIKYYISYLRTILPK